jgi:2-phosphosulfolactate phosphatase
LGYLDLMISHYLGIGEVAGLDEPPAVAVVVDVLRAFTVAAQAFAQGAERIVLAESLERALALKERHPAWVALKDGAPADGFDAVNSPGLLGAIPLAGRTVVQKTTAGTVGALAVRDAGLVLCAGFTVADATARLLRARRPSRVAFVVTGEEGAAPEDRACAEYIAHRVADPDADPAPYLRRAADSPAAAELAEGLRRGYRGVHAEDVPLCLQADHYLFAMAAAEEEDGLLVLRPAVC